MRSSLLAAVTLFAASVACASGENQGPASSGAGAGSGSGGGTGASTGGASTSSAATGGMGGAMMTTSSSAGGGGAGSGTGGTAGASSSGSGGAPVATFTDFCLGAPTTLAGTVYAPNGTDPLPNIEVYIAKQVNPFPAQFCDPCLMPIDQRYTSTLSAVDGSFTLDLDPVPYGATVEFVVRIGRFRKVTTLPVNACEDGMPPKAATTLPGKSADGEIPKIAVSTGNVDHLDDILDALGITEYDCYEGKATGASNSCALVPGKKIVDVLTNQAGTTPLSDYHMLFLSCAPNAYSTFTANPNYPAATINQNLQAFVQGGGRLIATDTAYDYIEQAFPDGIEFAGPAGVPQPVAGANVGCSSGANMVVNANVDDPDLAAWLPNVGVATSPSVQLKGFLQPWTVIESLPMTTTQIVSAPITLDEVPPINQCVAATRPLTGSFNVQNCGRVVYSSYHTLSSVNPQGLTAQEKILEYLMFSVASCHE